MEVEREMMRNLRQQRGWTQQQLAEIAELSLRTVQRVENQGLASNESVSALCAVLEIERAELLRKPDPARTRPRTRGMLVPVTLAAGLGAVLGAALTWLTMSL